MNGLVFFCKRAYVYLDICRNSVREAFNIKSVQFVYQHGSLRFQSWCLSNQSDGNVNLYLLCQADLVEVHVYYLARQRVLLDLANNNASQLLGSVQFETNEPCLTRVSQYMLKLCRVAL